MQAPTWAVYHSLDRIYKVTVKNRPNQTMYVVVRYDNAEEERARLRQHVEHLRNIWGDRVKCEFVSKVIHLEESSDKA